ncbi:oligoendopeptidase F [Ureaplasma miroungigenitalium]|uniref:Oligopeptidase F n=1 Tax=Ureaplasma miroungigenitalium TaxID=1042321 RepID=A0ABT3BMR8_9BACT|nr:oligoendopeptidase F [Ureaplasma miroungigenitalium]MCV3728518.1 oligoendopeptidase F [Ureaplasma miroungigenitalium]
MNKNQLYEWNLEDLLQNHTLEEVYEQVIDLKNQMLNHYPNFLKSKEDFKKWINLEDEQEKQTNRLYNYVHNHLNTNVADAYFNEWNQKVSNLLFDWHNALADFNEIVLDNEQLIRSYLQGELSAYTPRYEQIWRYKNHTLDKKSTQLFNLMDRMTTGFDDIYSTFTNNDMVFEPIFDKNNQKYEINSEADCFKYLKSEDECLRKQAYFSLHNAYVKNKASLTKMLYFNYLAYNQRAKAKNYKDYIHQATFEDEVDPQLITFIYNQVKTYKPSIVAYEQARDTYLQHLLKKLQVDVWDKRMTLYDKRVEYSVEDAKKMTLESLQVLGDDYIQAVQRAFDEQWVSWLPNKGKRSGAYSIGGIRGVDKYYILMNFDYSIESVQTIVHELGHSMHSMYANLNQPIFSEYKIFYAEIASVINEVLLNYYLLQKYKDDKKMRLLILDEMISGFIGTTTRQIVFSNFEWIANEKINNNEAFTEDMILKTYAQLNHEYAGKEMYDEKDVLYNLVNVTPLRIPHFYAGNFYVYKYAIGQICALLAGDRIYKDHKNVDYLFAFLKSGGSKSPLETIKLLNVDLLDSKTWSEGISIVNEWIDEYQTLIKELTK